MKVIQYIKDTKSEMKHVSWPTRKQSINFTLLIIAISIVTALLLGFFDYFFSIGLEKTISSQENIPAGQVIQGDTVQFNAGDVTTDIEETPTFNIEL